jgi:hypothetical protein
MSEGSVSVCLYIVYVCVQKQTGVLEKTKQCGVCMHRDNSYIQLFLSYNLFFHTIYSFYTNSNIQR